jgi:hypothetical protein
LAPSQKARHHADRDALLRELARTGRDLALPITDVAATGGWKDTETLLTCYQRADTQTLLAVMAEERKSTRASELASGNRAIKQITPV